MKILFVCLGNICRSPLAVGVLQKQVDVLNLNWQIASAGLANKYVGCTADPRVVTVATRHGVDLAQHIARKFKISDFDEYDRIITMDDELANRLRTKAIHLNQADKVCLLPDFLIGLGDNMDMPDPYFWDIELFEALFLKIETACRLIVETYNTPGILDLVADTLTTNTFVMGKRKNHMATV